MSTFLLLIIIAVVATAVFDWIYFLPKYKEMMELEKKVSKEL